jgi:hypothetical protein
MEDLSGRDRDSMQSVTPPPTSTPALDIDQLKKRAKGLVDETLRIGDLEEAFLTVQELGPSFISPLIERVMTKYVDEAKQPAQGKLLDFLKSLDTILADNREKVEIGIAECEYLTVLSDTVCEYKSSPEWLGDVVGTLVSLGACSLERLDVIVQDDIKINIDEMMAIEEETHEAYAKFMEVVKAY